MKKQTVKKPFNGKDPLPQHPLLPSQPIKMMPFIEESALRQLQQLYNLKPQSMPQSLGTLPAESMEATIIRAVNAAPDSRKKKDSAKITADLMDVDLDDDF